MSATDLETRLESYLALRSALGYSVDAERRALPDFVNFVDARLQSGPITSALTLDWACSSSGCGPAGKARRLSIVRGFLSHVRASLPNTEIPGRGLLASPRRARPYIYEDLEIRRLISAAQELGPPGSLNPHTYATLIGLLVTCGLRIGEALHLDSADVILDQEPARIVVIESKFHKSRIVPLHSTAVEQLREYSRRRGSIQPHDAFFASSQGTRLSRSAVWRAFDTIRREAKIAPRADGRRPTLHTLRHTFAVKRLLAWSREGLDVKAWLPHLSVYMGHAEPRDTYWYLEATPRLLVAAADAFDHFASEGGGR